MARLNPTNAGMDQLLQLMRAEAEREVHPHNVERNDNERPGGRQIAHVNPQQQIDCDNRQGAEAPLEQQPALKADPHTVFATSESEMHNNNPEPGQELGLRREGGAPRCTSRAEASDASQPFAGLDPFDVHGANGAFVETVVNPENDRLASAHANFHQRLAEQKIVGGKSRDVEFFDATEELAEDLFPPEFFPEQVEAASGVWNTSNLSDEKQITATMVNPFDHSKKA